jgi:acyl transferase domain-containing protein/NADPH:quinone reductase-like Zn-dependent oxidoreductase/acyl carrier protein/short-subunit dehydrogenase
LSVQENSKKAKRTTINPDQDAIALVGMAFRFPGNCDDEGSFWAALKEGRDLVTQIPTDRWATSELQHPKRSEPGRSITFSAGVLSRIDEFDAGFFGISPREAAWLDPQQRLLLELSWQAMENAGIAPSTLAGTNCAVYVGIAALDYGTRALDDMASLSANSMTGNTLSVAANRLSYVYDLRGPSLAVDTACSSSLVALHHACRAIQAGEADCALVGGVNLLLHPYPFVGFTKAAMLSATGRCRPFDAAADGYVRSEGAAVLLLKPYQQAVADGDDIQAVILASGVNADGARKTGITIPSAEGQAELMREVLARSGLAAGDVDFIEAHGTGTVVGDPVEATAIGEVYGKPHATPLPIGSVKANVGHMEAASGMVGLVKTVLALKHRALPGSIHLENPNPRIDFQALNLALSTEYRTLPASDRPLIAGVNSFGFGGANAHVLLQGPPAATPRLVATGAAADRLPPLLVSARSASALAALAGRYADELVAHGATVYEDVAYGAAFHRDRLDKALILQPASFADAVERLRGFADGGDSDAVLTGDTLAEPGDLAFVYSGNGSQWQGMGCRLLDESPRFAAILGELDALLQPLAGFSILRELRAPVAEYRLADTTVAQPLLFAVQVAVTLLLRERGIEPQAVTGHSVGEIAAAWACGALTLDQAAHVICARSQAQGLTRGTGRMAAVALSADALAPVLVELGLSARVSVAGYNSPANLTLSGDLESLARLQARLEPQGVFFRLLDLDYAFHSPYMDPIRDQLLLHLRNLEPSAPKSAAFVSTVTGNAITDGGLDAGYWWRNIREPVRFEAAVRRLADQGCRVFLEIGPHAILQRYLNESLAPLNLQARALGTLRRQDDGLQQIERAVGNCLLLSRPSVLRALFPVARPRVRLPNYPWQRERHWHPQSSESLLAIHRHREHPLLGWRLPDAEAAWENTLDATILPWLADHQVGGVIVFPGAAYAEMALAAGGFWRGNVPSVLESLEILAPMVFDGEHARSVRLAVNPRDGGFTILSRQRLSQDEWTLHAAGRLLESSGQLPTVRMPAPGDVRRAVDHDTHYALAASLGLAYGPAFRGLQSIRVYGDRLEATLDPPAGSESADYLLHPGVLDLCFQVLIAFFQDAIHAGHGVAMLPVRIGRLTLCGPGPARRLRVRVLRRGHRSLLADCELLDEGGALLALAEACRFRAAALNPNANKAVSRWRVSPRLRVHPHDEQRTTMPAPADVVPLCSDSLSPLLAARHQWFRETLPLTEILVLSFAFGACQDLAQQPGSPDWANMFDGPQASPMVRWLGTQLRAEGLLLPEGEGWKLAQDAEWPVAAELWRSLMRGNPAYLPQLALMGHWGRQLPALLRGDLDPLALRDRLRRSAVAESRYQGDPTYLGVRTALVAVLRSLAAALPPTRRLRVLEWTAALSGLPGTLLAALPEEQIDYVLVVADPALSDRQVAEYQNRPAVRVLGSSHDSQAVWQELGGERFDLIIYRHSLHLLSDPAAAVARARRQLAAGGLLIVAERNPDWSAHLVEGLDPAWWLTTAADGRADGPQATALPTAPLWQPAAWRQLLQDAGLGQSTVWCEPAAGDLAEGAYLVLAQCPEADVEAARALTSGAPAVVDPTADADRPVDTAGRWLLLVDEASLAFGTELSQGLCARGLSVAVRNAVPDTEAGSWAHCVSLIGWVESADQSAGPAIALMACAQKLMGLQIPPRLWIVTRGGGLGGGDQADGPAPSPAQAALWGFGRVLMNEAPALNCTLVDLGDGDADRLMRELCHPDGAHEILWRSGRREVPVMQEERRTSAAPRQRADRFHLDFHVPGKLRNLVWLRDAQRPLEDHAIEVQTRATGLNFRDVMYLMGLLPDEAVESGFAGASLGLEFSGVVSRVGAAVRDLSPGDPVMGFGSSCFASHVLTRADAVARMPEGWSFEAAATVPTVFFTVYYALKHLADLQPGERVLIHGGAGGVGIAAIQLARHIGAEIFATAGTDEKRDFVSLLGADHVFDSRSLAFDDQIRAATGGEGVDVVLNSLAGEAMRRSLDVLKPFGRFLELGKRDFFENTPLGLRPLRNNISYFGIDADQLLTGRPALAARLFAEVMALFADGTLAPLPYRCFTADRVVDAFRVMQQARHIGKIVVSLADARPPIEPPELTSQPLALSGDVTWLVTGGLSGFGLETARWLAARGVRHLVLLGRRGLDAPGAADAIRNLEALGVQAHARACDVCDAGAVRALLSEVRRTLPPLQGVVHAAAIFDDRLVSRLDADSMRGVLDTKLSGAWHLHQATLADPVRYFVLYASVTTAIGNPGQANYVAANAGLESLAALRRREGLPATCIAWGPIGDAGYLTRHEAVRDSLEQRLGRAPLSAARALDELGRILEQDRPSAIVADFDWNVLSRLLPSADSPRFAVLNRTRQDVDVATQDIRALIRGKDPETVLRIVRELVTGEVAQTLSIAPDRIDAQKSLHDLGMDSLMAVELALGLEQRFGIQLPVMMLNDAPTVASVAARIIERLTDDATGDDSDPSASVESSAADLVASVVGRHESGLSASELQDLAADTRQLAKTGTSLI